MIVTKIESIVFSGKRNLCWDDVEEYLDRFRGKKVIVIETEDEIVIGSHFASEYCGSMYTKKVFT